jgi:hypothetical protein
MIRLLLMLLNLTLAALLTGQPEAMLRSAQQDIDSLFRLSFVQDEPHLPAYLTTLDRLPFSPESAYWRAYARYQAAIVAMERGEEERAEILTAEGMALLRELADPDAEALALLGTLTSFSITFAPIKAIWLSRRADRYFTQALALDPDNLRALLGLGRADYYRPEQYGGGQEVEAYLQRALRVPELGSDDCHGPAWGRADAYYYLAAFYLREDRRQEARFLLTQGLRFYPDDQRLRSLQNELP